MRETRITLPELGLLAATRGMLGAGIGMLLANRLSSQQRKAVGTTLLLVGIITTIPIALEVLNSSRLTTIGEPDGHGRTSGRPAEERRSEVGSFVRS